MAFSYGDDRAGHTVGLRRTALVVCLFFLPCLATVEGSANEPAPRRHALLVGCTFYENLDEQWWLEGPANDVALIRRLLTGHPFGFEASDIATLAGWPPQERMRPTKENILREMGRLSHVVGAGDQVVILLAGHGSQQPADEDPADRELDGLDELFLPADAGDWNGEIGQVENAISDDELGALLKPLLEKGAFVWVIVDACHSGTMTRGAPRSVQRERLLPAEQLVPRKLLKKARRSQRSRARAVTQRSSTLDSAGRAANLVATYAAQPGERTPELPLPESGTRFQGLFSHTIAQVLGEAASPMTYRELADRVASRYRAMGRFSPTPLAEGGSLDREILGFRSWPDRPRIVLGNRLPGEPDAFNLHAGYLSGMRTGSVLKVFPPAGAEHAEESIGHVRVVRVEPTESEVRPVEYGGRAAPSADLLLPGSRCSIVYIDFGDMRTRLALQTERAEGTVTHAIGSGPAEIEQALAGLAADPSKLVVRVTDPAEADWFMRVTDGRVLLIPSAGWPLHAGRFMEMPSGAAFAPQEFVLGEIGELPGAVRKIARAQHLLRLAGDASRAAGDGQGLGLTVEMLKVEGSARRPVVFGREGRRLRPDDRIVFRVTNNGDVPVDVTLLFVDSGYGIKSIFPTRTSGQDNRLQPGKWLETATATVTDQTHGPEQLVAIAIKAAEHRTDLSYLEQDTLASEITRGSRTRVASPLTRLLERALYGLGTVRGLPWTPSAEYAVQLVAWSVVPRTDRTEESGDGVGSQRGRDMP